MGGIIAAGILLLGIPGLMVTIGAPIMTNSLMKIYNRKRGASNNSNYKDVMVFIGALIISILSMILLFLFIAFLIYKIIS